MNPQKIKLGILLFMFSLLVFSCRTEETLLIEPPEEEQLAVNSTIAILMQQVTLLDGSNDNIIDNANCITIQLPITVIIDGEELIIESELDFDTIEAIYDEFTDDLDELDIVFPITITLSDFTEVVINNSDELQSYASACNDENEIDLDIECLDFHYPIFASLYNANNELIETITLEDDEDLYDLIENLDANTIVTINFPITVTLWDGTDLVIDDMIELQSVIESAVNECDEDDDYDYNDDDCDNCSASDLEAILTDCDYWIVDKLERNDYDLEDIYVGYLFSFLNDGAINVVEGSNNYNGTWEITGEGNNIQMNIDITGLSDFDENWNLHEIEVNQEETKVDLRYGDDRLRFESDCNNGGPGPDDTELVASLTTGSWFVTYYFDDQDETSNYNYYEFYFATNGTASAVHTSGTTYGTWSTSTGDETELELNLNFGTNSPLNELAEDWDVLEVTSEIIRLKDVSGGNGSEEFLTFERDPINTGGDDLESILSDGLWYVSLYDDDGDNETADYNGYQLDFNTNGTVTASNGTNINGIWQVLSSGNKLLLDFGTSIPFDEFNDDWDVISAENNRVELQDVSGGNGGTDTLVFEKL